jgi:hypothetical protein
MKNFTGNSWAAHEYGLRKPDFTPSDAGRTEKSRKIVINSMAKQLRKYLGGFVPRGF